MARNMYSRLWWMARTSAARCWAPFSLEAEKAGIAAIRKVYGDWTKPGMASWMQLLQEK